MNEEEEKGGVQKIICKQKNLSDLNGSWRTYKFDLTKINEHEYQSGVSEFNAYLENRPHQGVL